MTEEKTYIVHLYFKKSLHIGASRSGVGIEATQEFIHSDTLWAAISNYWSILGQAGGVSFSEFINGFRMKTAQGNDSVINPLFRMTSAFPFTPEGHSRIYWLPKPSSVPYSLSSCNAGQAEQKKKYGKSFKEKRFITKETFLHWLLFNSELGSVIDCEEMAGISHGSLRAQATIDRLTNKASLYHSGITYLEHQTQSIGLYWLLRTGDKRVELGLREVFNVIRDIGGIGGNISSGCGELYHYEIADVDESWDFINNTPDANAFCLLSLCYPRVEEQSSIEPIAFEHVIRKGWTGSLATGLQKKRKTISMLAEGSVLSNALGGGIADVTPDLVKTPEWRGVHDVFRNGYAFLVPIKVNSED